MFLKIAHKRYPNDVITLTSFHDIIDTLSTNTDHVPNYGYTFIDGDIHSKLLYDFIWIYKNRNNRNKVFSKYGEHYYWYDELLKLFNCDFPVYGGYDYEAGDTIDSVMEGLVFYKFKRIAECIDKQTSSKEDEYLSEFTNMSFVDDTYQTLVSEYDYISRICSVKYTLLNDGLIPFLVYRAKPESFQLVKSKHVAGSYDEDFIYSKDNYMLGDEYYYFYPQEDDKLIGVIYTSGYYKLYEFNDISDIHGYIDSYISYGSIIYMKSADGKDIIPIKVGDHLTIDTTKKVICI